MRLAAACFVVALLVGGALAQEGEIDCKRMKVKELRQMLAARGVKCEGCAEKVPSLQRCQPATLGRRATPACLATALR